MKVNTDTEYRAARLEAIAAKRKKQAAPNDSDSSSEAMEENEFEDAPGIRIKGAAKRRQSGKQQFTRPVKHVPTSSAQLQSDSSSEEVALAKVKAAARPASSNPEPANGPAFQQRKHTDLPVKFTINTSFRGDHVYGNQVFRKTGLIIAHKNVGKSLLGRSGESQWEQYKAQDIPGLEKVEITFPNMVYEKKISMKLGGYYMEFRHFGRGYTNGDTVVFLPTFRAIIAGDMITNKETPSMEYAFIEDWIQALFSIENLNIEIIIPGHGGIAHKPAMILMRQYLMTLKSQVQKNLKAKMQKYGKKLA